MKDSAEHVWRLPNAVKGKDIRLEKGGESLSAFAPVPHIPPPSSSSHSGAGSASGHALAPSSASASASAAAKERLRRIVSKAPEAMVKVTGRSHGMAGHLQVQLDYITRNSQLPAETQDGQRITDRDGLCALHDEWLLANAVETRGQGGLHATQSVAIILSMPAGTPADKVEAAARAWANETFKGTHDWLMARHDDTDHPHVHVAVRAVGRDGRRLAPSPDDLQQWRERFARELRQLGLEAEATPRQARGVVRKAAPLSLHKAEQRGLESRMRSAQNQNAQRDVNAPETQPRNWSRDVQDRQAAIRQAYLGHADALMRGDTADRQLARDIRRFVADMPVALTRRQMMAVELRQVLEQAPSPGMPQTSLPSRDLDRELQEIPHRDANMTLPEPTLPGRRR